MVDQHVQVGKVRIDREETYLVGGGSPIGDENRPLARLPEGGNQAVMGREVDDAGTVQGKRRAYQHGGPACRRERAQADRRQFEGDRIARRPARLCGWLRHIGRHGSAGEFLDERRRQRARRHGGKGRPQEGHRRSPRSGRPAHASLNAFIDYFMKTYSPGASLSGANALPGCPSGGGATSAPDRSVSQSAHAGHQEPSRGALSASQVSGST